MGAKAKIASCVCVYILYIFVPCLFCYIKCCLKYVCFYGKCDCLRHTSCNMAHISAKIYIIFHAVVQISCQSIHRPDIHRCIIFVWVLVGGVVVVVDGLSNKCLRSMLNCM